MKHQRKDLEELKGMSQYDLRWSDKERPRATLEEGSPGSLGIQIPDTSTNQSKARAPQKSIKRLSYMEGTLEFMGQIHQLVLSRSATARSFQIAEWESVSVVDLFLPVVHTVSRRPCGVVPRYLNVRLASILSVGS